ncbi:hypothetical protein E4T66_18455 [Sinimarinibacterium sp. CAU 1509]|uniref:hypothetical protein n=1 Tax=Sinimarinibacterium sp. CAU 1509 TaxID=2562283 RepID=UPI0010AC5402|nr:hypothetical protein [Sinimarinibacterium sp. CAU 1509]TJY57389.1 hypothetical protein E4T66_18455 [Sinimarinibacterium sp. CAU 1509]
MLNHDAQLTFRAMRNEDVLATATLTGERAYAQVTYVYVQTYGACHDFVLGPESIAVSPEDDSFLSGFAEVGDATALRLGNPGESMAATFYSMNEENPDLTLDATSVTVVGPVDVLPDRIVCVPTGEVLATRTPEDYWLRDGLNYSDCCIAEWRPDRMDGQ